MRVRNHIENLPDELISIIYEYDGRYIKNFNVCMYELYTHIYNQRLMSQLYRQSIAHQSLYNYIRETTKKYNINIDEAN
jgi:hypothetical protein